MEIAEKRTAVINTAREWCGTPFHDNAEVKGVGVDCAHLLHAAYVEAGALDPFPVQPYSPQHFLHSDSELFLSYVERFAHEIAEADAQPADIVLYRVGRAFAHGAIIVEWPGRIIHAYIAFRCVAETRGDEGDLGDRKKRFFSIW